MAPERGESPSSTNRLPAFGPRRTTSMPMPAGELGEGGTELLVELQALGELGEAQGRFVLVGQRAATGRAEAGLRSRSGGRTGGIACPNGTPDSGPG